MIGTVYFLTHLSDSQEPLHSHSPRSVSTKPLELDDETFRQQLSLVRPSDKQPHSRTLGIADAIFVISLKRRQDRRDIMDSIAKALDLDFTYVDATDFKTPEGREIVDRLRNRVRWQRSRIDDRDALPDDWPTPDANKSDTYILNAFPFKWSEDVMKNKHDPLARPLGISGADYWDMDPPNEEWEKAHPLPPWAEEEQKADVMEASVMNNQNKERCITDAKFSCWHSHHRVIREIVRRRKPSPCFPSLTNTHSILELNAAIIFQDDIDLEWDIEQILRKQWPSLPDDWDIVYLGESCPPLSNCLLSEHTRSLLVGGMARRNASRSTYATEVLSYALSSRPCNLAKGSHQDPPALPFTRLRVLPSSRPRNQGSHSDALP